MSFENCEDDPGLDGVFRGDLDICQQLMARYSLSSASHHRHLLATAAAINSLLKSDSEPLTPSSYFSATIKNLSDTSGSLDSITVGALVSLLSIVTPLIPKNGITAENAGKAVSVLVRVASDNICSSKLGVGCVRGAVECIGILTSKFCDSENFDSVREEFETLIKFSLDKRPKVRRIALKSVESVFLSFSSNSIIKTASKLMYDTLVGVLPVEDESPKSEQVETLYVINLVTSIAPNLSPKIRLKYFSLFLQLLRPRFSPYIRNLIMAIEAFLPALDEGVIIRHFEHIVDSLCSYISSKENPSDAFKPCLALLTNLFQKCPAQANSMLLQNPSRLLNSIIGLASSMELSSVGYDFLNNLVDSCLVAKVSKKDNKFLVSLCISIEKSLSVHNDIPSAPLLKLISSLFLKLGEDSRNLMVQVVYKLGDLRKKFESNKLNFQELDRCIGTAVSVMGPETVLETFPLTFSTNNHFCTNFWLIPILKEYVVGASLKYYIEHLFPLSKSLHKAGGKDKKNGSRKNSRVHVQAIWELLCSFCRQPNDILNEAESLSKLMIKLLKKKSFNHQCIAIALQNLIKSCCVLDIDETGKPNEMESHSYLPSVSKKMASRNLKALSLCSSELLDALIDFYINSVPEKRLYIKDAIECVASITDSSACKNMIISLCTRFNVIINKVEQIVSTSEDCGPENQMKIDNLSEEIDHRHLILDISSLLVKSADKELVEFIYSIIVATLQDYENGFHAYSYQVLSKILQEHAWFSSSKLPELIDLVIAIKPTSDLPCIGNRLVCLRILMAHLLKDNIEEDEDKKAFLILNVIITSLKDKREDTRKLAYHSLVTLSSTLKDLSFTNSDEPLCKLINMILAYLSTPSPHVKSAAISALSVLIYDDAEISSKLPHLIPSVVSLLSTKPVEIIKAVLGFVKVVSSCLDAQRLQCILSDIVNGVLPWSSVSRNHFRSKVVVIMEIIIRKCGYSCVESATPNQFKNFLKTVSQNRHHRHDDTPRSENKPDSGRKRKTDEKLNQNPLKRSKLRGENEGNNRLKGVGMGRMMDKKMKGGQKGKSGNKSDLAVKGNRPKKLWRRQNR